MITQENHTTYLDVLSRRNWGTWAWAAAVALAMNLTLFAIMPYLLHRQPAKPVYEQLVSHINVIRIKRPDSAMQRITAKPPEPPQTREEIHPKAPARQLVMTKLDLPFAINPRLPAGPATLDLPPMEAAAYQNLGLQSAHSVGDLDGPLTPLARIPPVYPMGAKRRGIQGWVKVKFVINEQGTVEHISVVDAKPSGIFDQNVIRCVSKWRFKPGTVEGLPVKAWVETTVRFELE